MTRRLGAAAVAVLVLALTACSTTVEGSGRPGPGAVPLGKVGADATQALARVEADMAGLPHGFTVSFGQTGSSLRIDARYQGPDGRSQVTVDGEDCELVGVDHEGWARAGAAFWRASGRLDPQQAAAVDNRWVALDGVLASFGQYVDGDAFLNSLVSEGDPLFGEVSVYGGQSIQQIRIGPSVSIGVALASPHVVVDFGSDGSTVFGYPIDDLKVAVPSPVVALPR